VSTYPEAIQERLDELDRDKQRVLSHLPEALLVEECIKETGMGWYAAQTFGLTYYLAFDGLNLEHFLAPVFRFMRKHDYRFLRRTDRGDAGVCDIHFSKPDGSYSNISLYVTVPVTEGAACRFVEVGKKEVPVYELKCEEVTA
jgi:hypothetical protein